MSISWLSWLKRGGAPLMGQLDGPRGWAGGSVAGLGSGTTLAALRVTVSLSTIEALAVFCVLLVVVLPFGAAFVFAAVVLLAWPAAFASASAASLAPLAPAAFAFAAASPSDAGVSIA
jgi:hypothetical protein